jgi:hypothetical protein
MNPAQLYVDDGGIILVVVALLLEAGGSELVEFPQIVSKLNLGIHFKLTSFQ